MSQADGEHCRRPDCSWLSLQRLTGIDPPTLTPNPELSGIGVILGFSITAYITVALLIFHYVTIYDPHTRNKKTREHVNPVDQLATDLVRKHIISWRPTRRFEYAMEKSVLLLSDTQLVTGLAILIAGFSQLSCGISTYHWQTIVYIAWFSTFTFLSAVVFLDDFFHSNKALRLIRIFLMFALGGLQIAALLPTGSKNWLDVYGQGGDFYPSLSTQCYYKQLTSPSFAKRGPRTWSMVVSVLVVGLSYIHCALRLFDPTTNISQKYLFLSIRRYYSQCLHFLEKKAYGQGFRGALWTMLYVFFYAIFCNVRALIDIAQSMLGEILWLAGAIAWGSIKLWRTRVLVQLNPDVSSSDTVTFHEDLFAEDAWSFGQILPLILLLLPILAMLQSYLDNDAKAQETSQVAESPPPPEEKTRTPGENTTETPPDAARLTSVLFHSSSRAAHDTDKVDSAHSPQTPEFPKRVRHISFALSPKNSTFSPNRNPSIPYLAPHRRSVLSRLPRSPYPSFAGYPWYTDHIWLQIWQIIMLAAFVLTIQDLTINIFGVTYLLHSHIFLLWVFVCIPLASIIHLVFWYAAAAIVLRVPGAEDWLYGAGDFARAHKEAEGQGGMRKRFSWLRITKGEWVHWGLRTGLRAGLLTFTFFVPQELNGPRGFVFQI